jgi:CubicO group peptidase (beta-lactamase class C family)
MSRPEQKNSISATRRRSRKARAASLVAALVVSALALSGSPAPAIPFDTAKAASGSLDSEKWRAFERDIKVGRFGRVDAVRIYIAGRLAARFDRRRDYSSVYPLEGARGPYNYSDSNWYPWLPRSELHTIQSITKSVTALVFGIALRRGDIATLDAPIGITLKSSLPASMDPRVGAITTRHLLNMSSGLDWQSDRDTDQMELREPDWTRYILLRPVRRLPGQEFLYSDGDAALLAAIFKAQTGRDIAEYARAHLFKPLGIKRFYWKRTSAGMHDTEGGLYLAPDDLARIGQLVLNQGLHDDKQLYPIDYLDTAGRVARGVTPDRPAFTQDGDIADYTNLWWLPRHQADTLVIAGSGYGGQSLLIVPSRRLVAVIMSWSIDSQSATPGIFLGLPRVLELAPPAKEAGVP